MTQTSSPSAPSRAHARLQMSTTASSPMVDMTHSPCQRLVSTRVSTSGAPTTSTTQSSQEVETSPTTTISSLLQRQASQVSTSPGKSVAQRLSLSSVLQAQTLSQSMSGCSQSLQTMRLSQPIPQPRQYPRSKRITLTPGGGSQTAQKITNYLPTYVHDNITWNDWNVNDYEYQGAYSSGPQKLTYWYIIAKPADGATTSQIFMNAEAHLLLRTL